MQMSNVDLPFFLEIFKSCTDTLVQFVAYYYKIENGVCVCFSLTVGDCQAKRHLPIKMHITILEEFHRKSRKAIC